MWCLGKWGKGPGQIRGARILASTNLLMIKFTRIFKVYLRSTVLSFPRESLTDHADFEWGDLCSCGVQGYIWLDLKKLGSNANSEVEGEGNVSAECSVYSRRGKGL